MKYFRSRAALLDAEELKDEMAAQLLNNAKKIASKNRSRYETSKTYNTSGEYFMSLHNPLHLLID